MRAITTVMFCRSLEQAFKDLSGLMAKAAEMVELAEKFRTTMAAQRKAAQQGQIGSEQADPDAQHWMDTEMQAELINLGIASPVTRAETGARYHLELSRQVGFCIHAYRYHHCKLEVATILEFASDLMLVTC